MTFKRYLYNVNHLFSRLPMLAFSVFIIMSFVAQSNENAYQLTKVAELEHPSIPQPNWQQLIANPSNTRQHFVIRESGQIYLVDDDKIEPQTILDMSFYQKKSTLFKLTAIELHPNFSLRDQVGYGTFYTAHIENINKSSKTKRLQERGDDLQLSFDTVITEWQFSAINHQKVDVTTKREVLRIGVPDNLMVIKQMSFSPYVKSWNDDFGLLYVALNGENKWPQPLYSGVVLRINPAKFGLRSFTVPNNNPYMKNSQINDAIYLLGGQKIKQFIWPRKNSKYILLSHQYDNKHLLSLINGRNDWRDSMSKQVFYQSDNAIYDMLMYEGRELPLLRSKLLLLRQKEQQWTVESLDLNFSDYKVSDYKETRDEVKPQVEWLVSSQQLPTNSQVVLSSDHSGEIFFLEKTINILFRLTQQALANDNYVLKSAEKNSIEKDLPVTSILTLLFILMILGIIFYWFKRKSRSVKAIVRQQFASLELSESCQQISLFHRHQKSAEVVLEVVDIVSCEIQLNEHSISLVNAQNGHGFSNDKEQDLRTIFVNEKVDKMVDGKVRQISLRLTDNRKNSYTACLYMRKGSDRITKKSYVKVIDELIDWCWFIGEKVNAENTEKRNIKCIVLPNEKTEATASNQKKTPLHLHQSAVHQPAAIKPIIHKVDNAHQSLPADAISSTINDVDESKHSVKLVGKESSEEQQNTTVNTELVNALDKLVKLKQQGFLTMDEFSTAKEKLLKDLFEK